MADTGTIPAITECGVKFSDYFDWYIGMVDNRKIVLIIS